MGEPQPTLPQPTTPLDQQTNQRVEDLHRFVQILAGIGGAAIGLGYLLFFSQLGEIRQRLEKYQERVAVVETEAINTKERVKPLEDQVYRRTLSLPQK